MDKIRKIFDSLSKFFHLDIGYYIKNSFYLTFAQVVSTGIGLLLSITFTRLLTKELYGQWNYIFSILGFFAILTLPGLNTAVTQSVARGKDKVLIEATKVRFKWSVLGSLALFTIGIYYFVKGNVSLGKYIIIASLFLPFYHNLQIYTSFLSGKRQFKKQAKYPVIIQIVSVSITISVIYLSKNLTLILISNLLSVVLMRGIFFLKLQNILKIQLLKKMQFPLENTSHYKVSRVNLQHGEIKLLLDLYLVFLS